jgi:hypothetical protein
MDFDVSQFLTGGGSRHISEYEVTLARDMFTLGFEAGMFTYDSKVHWAEFTKDELLSNITHDIVMKSLLSDIFESGKSLGLKKRKKKGPADT